MIVRQIRALSRLLLRNWMRRPLRPGEAPKRGFPSTFLLNLATLAFMAPQVWNIARNVHGQGELRITGMQLGLWGLLLLNAASSLSLLTPELGKLRSPLRHELLDELPVSPFSIMMVTWLQNAGYGLLSLIYLLGLGDAISQGAGAIVYVVAFAVMFSLMACALGMAAVSLLRAWVPAPRRRRLTWLYWLSLASGVLAVVLSPYAAAAMSPVHFDPMHWLSRALLGSQRLSALCALSAASVVALAITSVCELRGYDRLDSAPPHRPERSAPSTLDMASVERLLFARESGSRAVVLMSVFGAALLSVMATSIRNPMVTQALAIQVVYLTLIFALQFAAAMVRRDLGARPFLSALPITPFQTLEGKIRALRLRLAPMALMALPFAWASLPTLGLFEVGWRLLGFLLSIWLLCAAAVPVAFLSNGLGAPSAVTLGGPRSFATLLLTMPVLSGTLARNPISALISLAMLAAIGHEARRSALRCVRFLDDAGEGERDTAVWRALLVLSAFFSTQALVAQLLTTLRVNEAYVLAITYAAAAGILALLTHQQRDGLPALRVMPRNKLALALGALAGAGSALLSLAFVKLLAHMQWLPADSRQVSAEGGALVAVLLAIVVMAPLAEELFFRGWLQSAIENELPREKRARAVLYAALAFAAVHFGSFYVPQLVLGLIAGALFFWSGALLPGILAHAVHNGLATLLGS
jgi:membrane protease YdiL (CAAX protease family)